MTIVNMHEAKTQLSRLVHKVEQGEEILIARNGKPVAKLSKAEAPTGRRPLGLMRGKVKIELPPDFDEEDEEINSLFYDGAVFPEE